MDLTTVQPLSKHDSSQISTCDQNSQVAHSENKAHQATPATAERAHGNTMLLPVIEHLGQLKKLTQATFARLQKSQNPAGFAKECKLLLMAIHRTSQLIQQSMAQQQPASAFLETDASKAAIREIQQLEEQLNAQEHHISTLETNLFNSHLELEKEKERNAYLRQLLKGF